jgi:hypothetical protein
VIPGIYPLGINWGGGETTMLGFLCKCYYACKRQKLISLGFFLYFGNMFNQYLLSSKYGNISIVFPHKCGNLGSPPPKKKVIYIISTSTFCFLFLAKNKKKKPLTVCEVCELVWVQVLGKFNRTFPIWTVAGFDELACPLVWV